MSVVNFDVSREEAKREVGPGWGLLVDELYDKLPEGVVVHCVKEKFGLLRVYVGDCTTEFDNYLDELEDRSALVCEYCGAEGFTQQRHNWIKTLCEVCGKHGGYIPV